MKGALNFEDDREHRVVIARARWTLETTAEVMRWYQLHTGYLGARFNEPQDLIALNDGFDVAAEVAQLWASYLVQLEDTVVGFWVGVGSNERVRRLIDLSGALNSGVRTTEAATVEDALDAIVAMRDAAANKRTVSQQLVRRPSSPYAIVVTEPRKPRRRS